MPYGNKRKNRNSYLCAMDSKERYINPFTDFGFKKLFGTEFNKELLVDFLNQVLGDRERIQDLTYLNTENLGNTETDRKAIFDLYCENESGEKSQLERICHTFFILQGIVNALHFPAGKRVLDMEYDLTQLERI